MTFKDSYVIDIKAENRLTNKATSFADAGYFVFPCGDDKKPLTEHGYKDASKDPRKIASWWGRNPDALIGLPCGANGLVVLDFDTYKPGRESIVAEFEAKAGHDLSKHPCIVHTPRGGVHYYFRAPEGVKITNSPKGIGIEGVDVRGEGGYVIAYGDVPELRNTPELPESIVKLLTGGTDVSASQVIGGLELLKSRGHAFADADGWEHEKPRLIDALVHIPADEREAWLEVGMAIHHAIGGSDEGREVWDEWSEQSDKFDGEEQHKTWRGFSDSHSNPKTLASVYQMAKQYGWEGEKAVAFKRSENPSDKLGEGGALTEATMASLKVKFERYGHHPSEQHWQGLREIAKAIEHMASGSLDASYYISSLPPGMGKTTTLIEATKNLLAGKEYADKSVVIFLSRLEEISKLVREMGLSDPDFSVLTSSDEHNALGNQNKKQARVMFTTQQMLESRCRSGKSFAAMADFHYEPNDFEPVGRPREVRVWDEAIVPSMSITLERNKIGKLFDEFGRYDKGLLDDLETFHVALRSVSDRALVTIPDLKEKYRLSENDVVGLFGKKAVEAEVAAKLWLLSGRTVRVRLDRGGNTVLDYEDILPDDMTPMLILDASGSLRKTYKFWYEDRGGLVHLFSPEKCYRNLTIHHWNKAGGKNAYEHGRGADQISRTAEAIRLLPRDEKVLVVGFKRDERKGIPDFSEAIMRQLRTDPDWLPFDDGNVSFVHYGKHTATNEFSECRHVFLMGSYAYPTSVYEAMARGAKGIAAEVELSPDDFANFKLGEIAHHIFQAANRGLVRKAEGDDCPRDCHLYVIAYHTTGVPQLLPEIFPGAVIEEWIPELKVTDRIKRAGDFILSKASGGKVTEIKDAEIMRHVIEAGKDLNKSNFNRTVLNHPDLKSYLMDGGYECRKERGKVIVTPAVDWQQKQ
jgi:hypothetical protein